MSRIAVLGAGAWGTALALSLHQRRGHTVSLWSHSAPHAADMQSAHENHKYLPNFPLPHDLEIHTDLARTVTNAEIILTVVPAQHLRTVIAQLAPALTKDHIIVTASKGIEDKTFLRMTQVVAELTPVQTAVLSGPSFAQEVAAGMPTAITIASADLDLAQNIQKEFSSTTLRLYTNDDVIGVELGGALKNVIALASGVVTGLNLGHNPAAALITRGIAEITRLAVACGGQPQTLAGLSGVGDLVLTCTGSLSRNRTVGIELGRGRALPDILAALDGKVAEGVRSTTAALGLAKLHNVEMPITEQMAAVLYQGKPPKEAIRDLMSRPGRDE